MLRELEMMFGLMIGTVGAVAVIAAFVLSKACKDNDKLRDNVKDAAKTAGSKAGIKIIEWILKSKK